MTTGTAECQGFTSLVKLAAPIYQIDNGWLMGELTNLVSPSDTWQYLRDHGPTAKGPRDEDEGGLFYQMGVLTSH